MADESNSEADRLVALGRLTMAAARIEYGAFIIARFAVGGDYKVFSAIAAHLSFEQTVALAKRVFTARESTAAASIAWLDTSARLMSKRNEFIHSAPLHGLVEIRTADGHPLEWGSLAFGGRRKSLIAAPAAKIAELAAELEAHANSLVITTDEGARA